MTRQPQSASTGVAELRALMLAAQRFRQAVADHFKVSLRETVLLSHLAEHAAGFTPRELATRMLLTSGTLTAVIDRLAADGFVARRPHPLDRRSVVVNLTPAGRRVIGYSQRRLQRALDRAAEDGMSGDHYLGRLAAALNDEADRLTAHH